MKIGNIPAGDYRAEGECLTVAFEGAALDRVEALDGAPVLRVTTDTGETVEWLRGYTLLSSVTIDREHGTVTAVFRHVSEAETQLAALAAKQAAQEAAQEDIMLAIAELGGLVAVGTAAVEEGGAL